MICTPNLIELTSKPGLPLWLSGKEYTCNARDAGGTGSIPGSGSSPGGGNRNPSILAWEKSHEQRSLPGYTPCGHKSIGHDRATEHTQTLVKQCKPVLLLFFRRFTTVASILLVSVLQVFYFFHFSLVLKLLASIMF